MRLRAGDLQFDTGPVPPGRWAYLAVGVHVSVFYVEAWRRWIASHANGGAR